MGIQGLLSFVKPSSTSVHLSDLKGKTVAIDSYCWIHKGAFGCAMKLGMGEDTDAYVQYCFKFIEMLRSFRITPIMVFDGQNLPAKQGTEEKRRESRALAKKKAIECMRLNKHGEARMNFIKSVDVTPEMALKLIKACRKQGIDCIVAPYEADAQLAYLSREGIVDIVITEDSDLLVFGCKKVLFKLDLSGNGVLVEKEKLHLSMDENPEVFNIDKFRHMCILSGCDYLDSLPGVGLKKAMKFIKGNSNLDIYEVLPKLPSSLKLKNLAVSDEYRTNFMIANATFCHQKVFDPLERQLIALSDPEACGTKPEYCCNSGAMMEQETAFQLAIGNLSPDDLKVMDNWCPDRDISEYAFKKSIWSRSYNRPQLNCIKDLKITIEPSFPKTKGLNVICDTKLLAEIQENEKKTEEKVKRDIEKMYFEEPPAKKICLENSSLPKQEERTSPIINKKRMFVKSRFFCSEKKTELLSPENSQKENLDSQNNENTEEILSPLTPTSENSNQSSQKENMESQNLHSPNSQSILKFEPLSPQKDLNTSSDTPKKFVFKKDPCETLRNKFQFNCNSTLTKKELVEVEANIQEEISEMMEDSEDCTIECDVKLTRTSITLESTRIQEKIVQKVEVKI